MSFQADYFGGSLTRDVYIYIYTINSFKWVTVLPPERYEDNFGASHGTCSRPSVFKGIALGAPRESLRTTHHVRLPRGISKVARGSFWRLR